MAWPFECDADRHSSPPDVVQRAVELGEHQHALRPPLLHPLPSLVRQVRVDALPRAPGGAGQSRPDHHRESSR
eukprot:1695903-Heterocapsa_arctica.AAC.1